MIVACENSTSGTLSDGNCVCNNGWTKASAAENCIYQENMPLSSFTDWTNYARDHHDSYGGWLAGHGHGEAMAAAACTKRGQGVTWENGNLFAGGHTVGRNKYTCTTGLNANNTGGRSATAPITQASADAWLNGDDVATAQGPRATDDFSWMENWDWSGMP